MLLKYMYTIRPTILYVNLVTKTATGRWNTKHYKKNIYSMS